MSNDAFCNQAEREEKDIPQTVYITTMIGDNYGSVLQAHALQYVLVQAGLDPVTVRVAVRNSIRSKIGYTLRHLKKGSPGIRRMFSDLKSKGKSQRIQKYYKDHIKQCVIPSISQVKTKLPSNSVYLCGSDQIWNPQFQPNALFYLDFEAAKKLSYACSIAVDELSEQSVHFFQDKLADFECLSVREETGKALLAQALPQCQIRRDVDPVLLVDSSFWARLASAKYAGMDYIFLYMLRPSEDLINTVAAYAHSLNKKVIYMGEIYYRNRDVYFDGNAGPADFLSALYHADQVITNSFHATAFSVLFHKNFASVAVSRTGSRVLDFLQMVSLEDRIIGEHRMENILSTPPDFTDAEKVIDRERSSSLVYIQQIATAVKGVSSHIPENAQ